MGLRFSLNPATECLFSNEDLMNVGGKLGDEYCSNCRMLGVFCKVSNHPPTASLLGKRPLVHIHEPLSTFPQGNTQLCGIMMGLPFIDRVQCVDNLHLQLCRYMTVLISTPHGSGKSSLMTRFASAYPQYKFVYMSFLQSKADPYKLLRDTIGIDKMTDSFSREVDLEPGCDLLKEWPSGLKGFVLVVDDAHEMFGNKLFWELLLGHIGVLKKQNKPAVKIILCAASGDVFGESFLIDKGAGRLQTNLLFSREEAEQLLNLAYPTGLHDSLKLPEVMKVVINECGGLALALRISVNVLNEKFALLADVSEADVLRHYFSREATRQLKRCFSNIPCKPRDMLFTDLLVDLLGGERCSPDYRGHYPALRSDEYTVLQMLERGGILARPDPDTLIYSSPLACRVISQYLFSTRLNITASKAAKSLCELVCRAIASMSADALRQSRQSVESGRRSEESEYLCHLLAGLNACTPSFWSVLPQLSRSFGNGMVVPGEADLLINGKWGLEVLIRGGGTKTKRVPRFSASGKYAPLRCEQFAVLDIRVESGKEPHGVEGETGKGLITAFFSKDYRSCRVFFGSEETEKISLKP